MKLVNAKYGINISFLENFVYCLTVENETALSDIVYQLYNQSMGKDGDFVLSDSRCKEIKIDKKAELVLEPFSLEINNRKNITQLYNEMSICCNEMNYGQKSEIIKQLITLVDNIRISTGYDIEFDLDISPEAIFKAMNVKFSVDYTDMKEKISQYLNIIASLGTVQLIIFVNFKSYFKECDLKEIYELAAAKKLNLLFIESFEKRIADFEKIFVLDKDLCIIEE